MRWPGLLLPGLVLLLAGCQSPSPAGGAPASRLDRARSVEITPQDEDYGRHRAAAEAAPRAKRHPRDAAELTEGELHHLPKFTVTRRGFLNFGLSVVTNAEVTLDGPIEWMTVGVVLPGSPAARAGLFTGIEILAIDNRPVTTLDRTDMLHALFERESGEQCRLLVYSRQFGPLPRFVVLGTGPAR